MASDGICSGGRGLIHLVCWGVLFASWAGTSCLLFSGEASYNTRPLSSRLAYTLHVVKTSRSRDLKLTTYSTEVTGQLWSDFPASTYNSTLCRFDHCHRPCLFAVSCWSRCTWFEFSQWPIVIAFHYNYSCVKVQPSVFSWWVDRARAPSQSVPNYMFLLEAPVSCVASPFVNLGQTELWPVSIELKAGPAHHTGVSLPRHPKFMASHRHVRNEKGMLVWPLFGQCCEATGSFTHHEPEKCRGLCPAESARQGSSNPMGEGVFGSFGSPFFCRDGHSIKTMFPWKQAVAGYLKTQYDTNAWPSQECWTGNFPISAKNPPHTHTHKHAYTLSRPLLLSRDLKVCSHLIVRLNFRQWQQWFSLTLFQKETEEKSSTFSSSSPDVNL